MRAHWVDRAKGEELDRLGSLVETERLPDEDDESLRARLKRAVDEYRGGGTLPAVHAGIKDHVHIDDEDVKIVENPPADAVYEKLVSSNDTWTFESNSIKDEQATTVSLTVESEGEVCNPQITNIDTKESIVFKGKLATGEQLVIKKKKASLGTEDVTENVSSLELPRILRRGSAWKYSEALSERIATFDVGKFDEHIFAIGVPTVRVRFEWTRYQPATFMVQIRSNALAKSGFTKAYLERTVNSMKAAGVNAIVRVME
jgi:hypothetical protein